MPRKNKSNKELMQKAKGMQDILPAEFILRKKFIEKAEEIAGFYGFRPIQTPHLEKLELFAKAIGENTDIVEKEMYSLKTKGGDKLALRPEGTPPIVRAYFEHGMHTKPQPVMFYYHGSFFRHDKPQKGRRREFQQFGLEILGEKDSITDAILIKTALTVLEEAAGLKNISISLNSLGCKECRKAYLKELTAYYKRKIKSICKNCETRLKNNPLRILDCKEEKCGEIKKEAPQIMSHLCAECTEHFKNLLETLEASSIPYYIDPYLVRGLDYYTNTVFEIFSDDDKTMALCGGGRYDGLSALLGGKELPATGCAMGIDRIALKIKEGGKPSKHKKQPKIFFIQLGIEAKRKSLALLEMLRKTKIPVKHSISKTSIKSQLKIADKYAAPYSIIMGQKEALENSVIVRNMETASQETIKIEKLPEYLKKKIK